ncbi:30S ribosomal protein S16 [Patescibacteria group bacterium]|nr:30S ribosomal protein S16 [Patescibacteria group bacterium]
MLKIRLQKVGKKNAPSYRVVLAEHTSKPKGKFIEILGSYNPRLKERAFKADRIKHWISMGAKVSPTVHNLLITDKIIEGEKVKAWRPKKKTKEEKPAKKLGVTTEETPSEEVKPEEIKEEVKPEEEQKPAEEKPNEIKPEETPKEEKQELVEEKTKPEQVAEQVKQEAQEVKEELKEEIVDK